MSSDYQLVIDRAVERIEEAILFAIVGKGSPTIEIEILSFPVAVMIVAAMDDAFIKRRYALAESKRVSNLLLSESTAKLLEISTNFHWKIQPVEFQVKSHHFDFALHLTDYLRNSSILRDKKWKLVNRVVEKGEVYITKTEEPRLLEEEVQRYIQGKLAIKVGMLPQPIRSHVERLKQLYTEKFGTRTREIDLPKTVIRSAFPPCIKNLYDATLSGLHISHVGRFTLTSFLVNIGMPIQEIIDLFHSFTDFNERMTRYQVEHIAGERGSRTRYTSPKCDTLQTHGICPEKDETCRTIHHPLTYYLRRVRSDKTEAQSDGSRSN